MRSRWRPTGTPIMEKETSDTTQPQPNLEVRSSGMVVQKRNPESVSSIKVRVKNGSSFLEISLNPQASFGDLKKLLADPTGLHPDEQKLIFKKKERLSKTFLDVVGVKNGSKIVLMEDTAGREKRLLEKLKLSNMHKASKIIKDVSKEVDILAEKVRAIELAGNSGGSVSSTEVSSLIESLMIQVVKLDGVVASDSDLKQERNFQERRIQKLVEYLELLAHKKKNPPAAEKKKKKNTVEKSANRHQFMPVTAKTRWETFDSGATDNSKLNWETFE